MDPTVLITSFLQLIGLLLPNLTSSAVIAKVVSLLIQIVPLAIQEARDLLPEIKAIIAALSANPATEQEQLDTLAAQDAAIDAAFDAAADAATAEDAAASGTAGAI